jgi:hypothetical protein
MNELETLRALHAIQTEEFKMRGSLLLLSASIAETVKRLKDAATQREALTTKLMALRGHICPV